MAEKRSNHMGPRDYDGGESLNNFHSNFQIIRDIDFLKKILPAHYVVQESNKRGSVHCKSKVGIRLYPYKNKSGNMITDQEDEEMWEYIMKAIKQHFGPRFSEVFHNTCFCHVDFTVYLKQQK
jgi:hypothetical protein